MYSFLLYISSNIILFSILVPVNVQGLYAPLAVTNYKIELIVANIEKYTNESGVLLENIILACPPNSETEDAINSASNTKNSLIIKKFLQKGSIYEKTGNDIICEKEIMPSSIWDPNSKIYRVGYEITDVNNLIEETLGGMNRPKFFEGNFQWVQTYGMSMKFTDYYKFAFYTPFSTDSTTVISPPDLCKKFETLENEAVDKFFSSNIQKLNLHSENSASSSENVLESSHSDTNSRAPPVKVYLTEPEDFDNYYSKLSTCFKINISAMWKPIYDKAWKKVGNFMRDINNKLSKKGKITFLRGNDGVFMMPTNEESKPILMAPKIQVPERFWNFVSYIAEDGTTYGIYIIIHNDVNNKMNRMCEEDVCEKYKWKVENDDFRTGETYCCDPNKMKSESIPNKNIKLIQPFDLSQLL